MEPVARTLIAGRAAWFYVSKLIAPVNLAFIYPRWNIDVAAWWQYLFPLAAGGLVGALWMLRHCIGRGPVAAVLIFGGTLLPALGYFNVFPHRYSFVADHFQYHASVAMIVVLAAMLTLALSPRRIVPVASIVLVLLALQTFRQSRIYHDPITLWSDTVEKNPGGWMPWTNLGNALVAAGRIEEAIPHYERALALAPDVYDVQWNAGVARVRQGEVDAAEQHFRRAIQIQPRFVPGYVSLGDLELLQRNDPAAAVQWYEQALEIAPYHADARLQYARALLRMERIDDAVAAYRDAVAAAEGNASAHYELAMVLLDRGELDEAIWNLREVVRFETRHADAHARLGVALLIRGERTGAVEHLRRALAIDPQHAIARQALRATQGP
jgi:protein O-mannosyl-transferase